MVKNQLMRIIFLIVLLPVLVFFFVRFLERKNLYFPLQKIESTPKNIGLDYEDVSFQTKDGVQLSGWFISSENARAAVIFCHGNGGNISHRLHNIKLLNSLSLDVLIFDYRGYGMSKGTPSENGLYIDTEAAYDYLVNEKKVSPRKILIYGESLGGAVAVDLAGKKELGGIIIEGGFTSVSDMAKRILPFIPIFIYKTRFNSVEKIKNIRAPKLIFHSLDDEIVPFELGEKLFHAAAEPKEFVKIRGGHNDALFISEKVFILKIDEFVKKVEE